MGYGERKKERVREERRGGVRMKRYVVRVGRGEEEGRGGWKRQRE